MDRVLRERLLRLEGEVDEADVHRRNADGLAVELAGESRDDLGEGLRGARRGRDHVLRGRASAAEVALAVRDVQDGLVVRVRVDGRHEAALDPEVVVQDLGDRGEAVRRARAARDHAVLAAVVDLVVDAEHDRRVVTLGRCRDDDLLRARLEVSLGLLLVGEEARALEHDVDAEIPPRELTGLLLGDDLDRLAGDLDRALFRRGARLGAAVDGVVVVEVCEGLRVREVVDRDDVEIAERRRRSQALTRPELAVLLAYAKLTLYSDLLETTVPDDPYLGKELARYFPAELTRRFPEELEHHRLRREIIATYLTNSIINRGGPSLIARMTDETGASPERIARAFAAVRDSYDMTALNGEIDALDNKISGALQLELYAGVKALLIDRMVWFIRNVDLNQGLASIVAHYRGGIEEVSRALDEALAEDAANARAARARELSEAGVPDKLALRIASLRALNVAPDIVLVADRTQRSISDVARTFLAVVRYFRLERIGNAARDIKATDYFDRLALDRARDSFGRAARQLTAEMLAGGQSGTEAVDAWVAPRVSEVERIRTSMHEIADTGMSLSKLAVAASLLGDLAGD